MMDAAIAAVFVCPYHFFVARYFQQLDFASLGVVAGDNGVAVAEALHATGVVDRFARQIVVGNAPYFFGCGINFNDKISKSATDERVAIWQADSCEWPMRRFGFPDYFASSVVFANNLVE